MDTFFLFFSPLSDPEGPPPCCLVLSCAAPSAGTTVARLGSLLLPASFLPGGPSCLNAGDTA